MNLRLGRVLAVTTFLGLGLLILSDSTSNVLIAHDAQFPERKVACYTGLELALGVTEPSAWRLVEDVVGLALVLYAPWAGKKRLPRDTSGASANRAHDSEGPSDQSNVVKLIAVLLGAAAAYATALILAPWPDLLDDEASALGQIGWYVEMFKTPLPFLVGVLVYIGSKGLFPRKAISR